MTTRAFLHEVYLSDFGNYVGLQDEGYFDALVRMFELVLKIPSVWPTRNASRYVIGWLDFVRSTCQNFGYGVGDEMDNLFAEYRADD